MYWAASDIGWVVGHTYIVYAPLLHGCTTILYEGKPVGTPDAGAFWRVIAEHECVALFTAPTAFRAIKKEDPTGKLIAQYDFSKFRTLFLAGERADPATIEWAEQLLKVPVIDHWWQTETGWAIAGNPLGLGMLPVKHGSPTVPMPGYDVRIVDEAVQGSAGRQDGLDRRQAAAAARHACRRCGSRTSASGKATSPSSPATTRPPTPASWTRTATCSSWAAPTTSSTSRGIGSRPAAWRRCSPAHPDVAECAVIGIADALKGEVPCGFIVLKAGVNREPGEIEKEIVALVREKIGPVAAFKLAITVPRLPKTRSGKILRGTMKKIADGETLDHARDDRGPEGARGDRRGTEGEGNRNIERRQFAKAEQPNRWEGCHAHHSILRRLAWLLCVRRACARAGQISEPAGEVRGELRGRRLERHHCARAVRLALGPFRPAVHRGEPHRRERQCRRGNR